MGHLARRKIHSKGLDLPLVRGRVQALPFEDNSFPSILSTFPAEFITSPSALAEFYRVLQPGGVMVIVPLALITGSALPDRFADWLFRVTGQTGDWHTPLNAIYTAAGFSTRAERLRLPRSVVMVIIAEKN
jgi:ubiquinone/menaquinone biosynthesis C-methylase UbiE